MGTCFETSVEKHGEPRRVKPVGFTRLWASEMRFFRPPLHPEIETTIRPAARGGGIPRAGSWRYAAIGMDVWSLSEAIAPADWTASDVERGKSRREARTSAPSAK